MYYLQADNDARNSFYNKASVEIKKNSKVLFSYNTKVAQIKKNVVKIFNTQSPTTVRHIKEFLKQEGFKAENKKQIIKDYS